MQAKSKIQPDNIKAVLLAVKKLSASEKQLIKLQLFSDDALSEMKAFEKKLKKEKKIIKKTDLEIVAITTSIRREKYANAKNMLH